MNELQTVLAAVLPVFCLMATGLLLRKLNWLTEEADHSLLRVTVNLLVPCFILDKLLGNAAVADFGNVWLPPLVGFGTVALGVVFCWWLAGAAGLKERASARTFAFSAGVYNYGYIPLPLALSLFNRETVGVLIVHNVGVEIAFWSLGLLFLSPQGRGSVWQKIFSPPVFAILIALTLNFTGLQSQIPVFVRGTASMLGQCAIPLGLILIGATVADHWHEFHSAAGGRVMLVGCLARLALLPPLFLLLAKYLPCSVELKRVIVLQAAMPAAVFNIIMAKHYGGDAPTALRIVIATSVVSLVTIPFWIRFGIQFVGI
jgi:predicted permease